MTTPATSAQIVLGKLLGKLLQLVTILLLSLPLLALVRVFGGVQWRYVLEGTALTLATVLAAGALGIWLSVYSRRSYVVIIQALIVLAVVEVGGPLLLMVMAGPQGAQEMVEFLVVCNPLAAMLIAMAEMFRPGSTGIVTSVAWPITICLVLTMAMVAIAAKVVRRVAMRQALGEAPNTPAAGPLQTSAHGATTARRGEGGEVRRVIGPPMIWKERRGRLLGWGISTKGFVLALGLVLLCAYLLLADKGMLSDEGVQVFFGLVFLAVGVVGTTVIAAAAIPAEKEARNWPILLATPLSEWTILQGKAFGAIRRSLVAWAPLMGHSLLMVIFGQLHPWAALHVAVIGAYCLMTLVAMGMLVGSRMKRTTTSVTVALVVVLCVWLAGPFLTALMGEAGLVGKEAFETTLVPNPGVQTIVTFDGSAEGNLWPTSHEFRRYHWPDPVNGASGGETLLVMLLTSGGYALLSALLLAGALARVRREQRGR
jgi:ABC-type transport system involved in multi-copper enzyme maturation permease subunit